MLPQTISMGEPPSPFMNHISSKKKLDLSEMDDLSQETAMITDFLEVCKGHNAPNIQCEFGDNDELIWHVNDTVNQRLFAKIQECLQSVTLYYEILNVCARKSAGKMFHRMYTLGLRADMTAGPMAYTVCAVVEKNLRIRILPELLRVERGNIRSVTRDVTAKLHWLHVIVDAIEKSEYVGGPLLTYVLTCSDRNNEFVRGVLQEVRSLMLRRYYHILFEWLTQCTLSSDLAHEFFIWDLSKVKSIHRIDFTKRDYGNTAFDERFVVIPDLCPHLLEPVRDEIVRIGKYFYTLQTQKSVSMRLLYQQHITEEHYKNKSPKEIRDLVRDTCKQVSTLMLNHFVERYNVHNLANAELLPQHELRLGGGPRHAGGTEPYASPITSLEEMRVLAALYEHAIDRSNLRNDEFRSLFSLKLSQSAQNDLEVNGLDSSAEEPSVVHAARSLEMHLVGDPSLNLVFPTRIIEPYRNLFGLNFMLHRAVHLLHRRRFGCEDEDEENQVAGSREELATIVLFLRFLNMYHDFVFVTVLRNEWAKFLTKVSGLDQLEALQYEFLSKVLHTACLDTPSGKDVVPFSKSMIGLIQLIIDYATGRTSLAMTSIQVSEAIRKLTRVMSGSEDMRVLRKRIEKMFSCQQQDYEDSANGD
ncbi:Spc97 / Spc98 family protein [Aphelenchoides avenae]|nr:Spc97 / Spc98 family protein [Aphelenchus avenae]